VPPGIGNLIRDALAAYERGGFAEVTPLVHPELEIFAPPELINSGEAHGQEEAAAWTREWGDAWQAERYEVGEIEELAPDRAVAAMLVTATGRSSGITTEMRQWWFFEAREGKLARWHLYPDRERAIAAAGEPRS
jgi:ketosteroid isomerase-like protein